MAVTRSVSFGDQQFADMMKRGINPTKCAKLGAKIYLAGGEQAMENMKDLQDRVEMKQVRIEDLEKQVSNLQEEVAYLRPKVVDAELKKREKSKKQEPEKK